MSSSSSSSSFKRLGSAQPRANLPPGTRLAPFSGQPVVSTGIASLDEILGGGMPVGTVLCVVQDRYTSYHRVVMRYYVAQGAWMGREQRSLFVTAEDDPAATLQSLPSWQTKDDKEEKREEEDKTRGGSDEGRMKIAWRYEGLPLVRDSTATTSRSGSSSSGGEKGSAAAAANFNLAETASMADVDAADIVTVDLRPSLLADASTFDRAFEEIERAVASEFDSWKPAAPGETRRVLRIAVDSFASPFWHRRHANDVARFLHRLRSLLRHAFAVCMLTFPAHLHPPPTARLVQRYCDAVVELSSFTDADESARMGGYHGILRLHRASHEAVLVPTALKLGWVGQDMGFRLYGRRRGLAIERLALPPEGGVSERRVVSGKVSRDVSGGSTEGHPMLGKSRDPLEF